MATTTNYSWTTPDDTALVKDGAAAIRSLGTAIDTTVFTNAGAAVAKATVDAKGDLIAGTADNTIARLGVGANDTVLTADSSTATGLKWAAPAAGGMTLLSTTTLSGATTTISSISGSYLNLVLVIRNYLPSTQRDLTMQFNSDTGTNYLYVDSTATGATLTFNASNIRLNEDQHTSGTNLINSTIFDYANTTTPKTCHTIGFTTKNGTPQYALTDIRGTWNDISAITSITLRLASGTFSSGTALLYGVK
jgi:hypothetical protein